MKYTAKNLIAERKKRWSGNIEQDKIFREAVANEIMQNALLRNEVINNPEYLIELCFVIVDKEKNTMPFFLNGVQHDFINRLNKAIDDYSKGLITEISLLVLKGRQQGFTSLITAYQLANILLRKNFEGFTVADESDNAETIFENKAKYPYSRLPEVLKPTEKYNNRRQIQFDKINSSWTVEVATKQIGRSRTINFLHASEGAFWRFGIATTQASLGEALTKDCIKIYESTANGLNDYNEMWESGVHINCFYEWWRTVEYSLRFETEIVKATFENNIKNSKEWVFERIRWLLDRGVTINQCYWYYKKYQNYIDKELIKQEYPCFPGEAFLASGRPVFNVETVQKRIYELQEHYKSNPYKEGYFSYEWNNAEVRDYIKDDTIKFIEDKQRPFVRLYKDPAEGIPYVIGGDTKGEGKDFFAGTVLDNTTGKRTATIHMQVSDSKPYTWQMYCMGRYFNTALVSIEINFNTAPIEELQRLKYNKQYVRRKYDNFTKQTEKKFGWKTDGNTRPLIIDKEIDIINNHVDLFMDIPTLQEALTFVYDDENRPDALSGKHDDLLISDMIANECRSQQTFDIKKPEGEKAIYNFDFERPPKSPTGFGDKVRII